MKRPCANLTPSENTVRFYLGRGFQPMAEPSAELFELEPEDVHSARGFERWLITFAEGFNGSRAHARTQPEG